MQREKKERKKEKKTVNSVATMFATQRVCNAAQAAHALRSDQFSGHYICHAARLQRRMGSARTLLGPIEERREKNNEFSGHYVCHAAYLQRRTGSIYTSFRPIQWPLCLPRS